MAPGRDVDRAPAPARPGDAGYRRTARRRLPRCYLRPASRPERPITIPPLRGPGLHDRRAERERRALRPGGRPRSGGAPKRVQTAHLGRHRLRQGRSSTRWSRCSLQRAASSLGAAAAARQLRHLEGRGLEGGDVTIRDLVRHVLRHRLDHIVVGSGRRRGLPTLRRPSTTVHGGSLATVHANHAADCALAPGDLRDAGDDALPSAVACRGVVDGIEAVIHQAGRRSESAAWRRWSASAATTCTRTGGWVEEAWPPPAEAARTASRQELTGGTGPRARRSDAAVPR